MDWSLIPYLAHYGVSLGISLGIGLYALRHRSLTGAGSFSIYALSQALWTGLYILELLSREPEDKLFWDALQWLPMFISAFAGLRLALQYSEQRLQHARRVWSLLLILPVGFGLLTLTNPLHGFVYTNVRVVDASAFDALLYDFTPLIWSIIAYSLVVVMIGIGLLARQLLTSRGLRRAQLTMMILGLAIPALVPTVLAALEITLFGQRDVSPLTFAVGNLFITWGLFRLRLIELPPVAHAMVFDAIDDAVIVVDADNRVVDLNRMARRAVDARVPEPVGEKLERVFPDWAAKAVAFVDDEPVETEVRANCPQGGRALELRATPLRSRRGRHLGRVLLMRDITERQRAANAVLERERLQAALVKEHELNGLKNRMMIRIAHEFRTPLSVIQSAAEMLERYHECMSPTQRSEKVEQIREEIAHVGAILDDLKLIVQGQNGQSRLLRTVAPLAKLCADVVSRRQTIDADHTYHFESGTWNTVVAADSQTIDTVLTRLLQNAAAYSPVGTSITVRISGDEHGTLLVVDDHGIGIPPLEQARIFEPFFRGSNIGEVSGMGLGLSVVHYLLTQCGATIDVSSVPGEGSTFIICFPAPSESAHAS